MTNEQLAGLIQQGRTEYISQLWSQVERFVAWRARKVCALRGGVGGVTFEDLCQSGFLALIGAVKYFDERYNGSFLTVFNFFLKREFDRAAGIHRSRKKLYDAIDGSVSLDVPLAEDSDTTLCEIVPDKGAEESIDAVGEMEAWLQMVQAVAEAVETLSDQQKEVLHYIYWMRLTRADIAAETGLSEKDVEKISHDAIRKLRHPKVSRNLRQYVSA